MRQEGKKCNQELSKSFKRNFVLNFLRMYYCYFYHLVKIHDFLDVKWNVSELYRNATKYTERNLLELNFELNQ